MQRTIHICHQREKDWWMSLVCKSCTAVYHNKKWFLDAKLYEQKKKLKDINWVTCPACKKTRKTSQRCCDAEGRFPETAQTGDSKSDS